MAVVTRTRTKGDDPPLALGPGWPYTTDAQVDALFRFADRVADVGVEPCGRLDAGTDLLLRRTPRLRPGTPPLDDEPMDLDRLKAQVRGLDEQRPHGPGPARDRARPGPARGSRSTCWSAACASALPRRRTRPSTTCLPRSTRRRTSAARPSAGGRSAATPRTPTTARGSSPPRSRPSEDDGPIRLIGATAWHWAAEGEHDSRRRAVHRRGRPDVARRRDRGLPGRAERRAARRSPAARARQPGHPSARQRRVRPGAPARRSRHRAARPRRLPRHVVAHAPRRLRLRLAHDVRRSPHVGRGRRAPARRLAGPERQRAAHAGRRPPRQPRSLDRGGRGDRRSGRSCCWREPGPTATASCAR